MSIQCFRFPLDFIQNCPCQKETLKHMLFSFLFFSQNITFHVDVNNRFTLFTKLASTSFMGSRLSCKYVKVWFKKGCMQDSNS